MVSVCLPSDALSQYLPSYLGFSYLVCGVSLHSCSSEAQPLFLTLDEGHLLMAAPPDLQHGVAPLGPPAPTQPPLLWYGVTPLSRLSWPRVCGSSSRLLIYLIKGIIYFIVIIILVMPPGMQDLDFLIRDQTSNPLQWKRRVLITGLPGNSHTKVHTWLHDSLARNHV